MSKYFPITNRKEQIILHCNGAVLLFYTDLQSVHKQVDQQLYHGEAIKKCLFQICLKQAYDNPAKVHTNHAFKTYGSQNTHSHSV